MLIHSRREWFLNLFRLPLLLPVLFLFTFLLNPAEFTELKKTSYTGASIASQQVRLPPATHLKAWFYFQPSSLLTLLGRQWKEASHVGDLALALPSLGCYGNVRSEPVEDRVLCTSLSITPQFK